MREAGTLAALVLMVLVIAAVIPQFRQATYEETKDLKTRRRSTVGEDEVSFNQQRAGCNNLSAQASNLTHFPKRCERSDFRHDFRRMLIIPICTQPVGDFLNYLPIRLRSVQRFEDFVKTLNAPLGIGKLHPTPQ